MLLFNLILFKSIVAQRHSKRSQRVKNILECLGLRGRQGLSPSPLWTKIAVLSWFRPY
jgi:hypothetical protein